MRDLPGPSPSLLAEPVQRWIADARRYRAEISDADSIDLRSRRQAARDMSDRLAHTYTAPAPEEVNIDDLMVPGGDGRIVRVRRYRSSSANGRLPTQIWLHGGGFVSGAVDELVNDRLCAARSAATGVQILSVEYRLAPEHPYPAPIDDTVAVFDAAVDDPGLQGDPDRIGIGGNSAGGAIAASSALRIRDTRPVPLIHLLLEVPQVAFEPIGDSAVGFDLNEGPLAAPRALSALDAKRFAAEAYLPSGSLDHYAVPLDADPSGLPPTMIMTAEFDPLRDGGEAYAAHLLAAGVSVDAVRGEGQLHATCSLTAAWDRARQWQADANAAMLRAYFS